MYSKSESTIDAILEAAERLFVAKHYADVTMDEIAEAASVTKGALYHHFPSKQQLYLTMLHNDLERKKALFKEAVDSPGTCRERLYRLTEAFFQLADEKRRLIQLVRRDVNIFRNPERAKLVRAYQAALPNQVEAIIRDGIRDGELADGDARLLAWMHVAQVEVMLADYAERVFDSQQALLDYQTDLFFYGAAKRAASR
jgi:AcrR family transcriptional regulator